MRGNVADAIPVSFNLAHGDMVSLGIFFSYKTHRDVV